MGKRRDDEVDVGEELKRAASTCRKLAGLLGARVEKITAAGATIGTEAEAKQLLGSLQAHQRAIQTVLEWESRLGQQIAERDRARNGELDLEEARREIMGELSRLAERA